MSAADQINQSGKVEEQPEVHPWQEMLATGKSFLPSEEQMPEKKLDAAQRMYREHTKAGSN